MHLSEGLLRPEILIGGAVVSAAFTLYAFKTLKDDEIPKTAVLSALFFLASFIHVPIGPTSVHLVLGGIVGAMLGFRAFIAIFVALLLQGVLFGFGGLTTLGINLFNLATPTLVGYWLFMLPTTKRWQKDLLWFLVGFVPLALSAFLLSLTLALNGDAFVDASKLALLAHLPIMFIEGFITLFALRFIEKVSPHLLHVKEHYVTHRAA
ncbi:cobalt transporter CbiM [Sulfurospirillum halorespirans]|uniref:Putative substrate-specific component of nickel/cobalt ECF transporter, NikM n=1 Tax=Sulfurospirillum halorespirans DSM 13726 TaxID=1193502 RepID=A0A1D7TK40_9BACT|nr:cobalt transporter CbiM [Sulfurospirillum halorespirans]AOO65363.1 putative substrate-specific component of nickel/cobalt ECF transporter, NikM [Sulfurospirillum halorespirans DSM 13726]